MTPVPLPTLFVSHGAPTLPLAPDVPAHRFLAGLGNRFPKIAAVLCISAHGNTERPTGNALKKPETIHDFFGFPIELYRITYPAREVLTSPVGLPLLRRLQGSPATLMPAGVSTTGHGYRSC